MRKSRRSKRSRRRLRPCMELGRWHFLGLLVSQETLSGYCRELSVLPRSFIFITRTPKNPRLGSPSVSAETLNPKVKNLSFRSPGHSKVGAFNSTELARQEVQDLAEG